MNAHASEKLKGTAVLEGPTPSWAFPPGIPPYSPSNGWGMILSWLWQGE